MSYKLANSKVLNTVTYHTILHHIQQASSF